MYVLYQPKLMNIAFCACWESKIHHSSSWLPSICWKMYEVNILDKNGRIEWRDQVWSMMELDEIFRSLSSVLSSYKALINRESLKCRKLSRAVILRMLSCKTKSTSFNNTVAISWYGSQGFFLWWFFRMHSTEILCKSIICAQHRCKRLYFHFYSLHV